MHDTDATISTSRRVNRPGLPIGLQITGAQFDEQKILQVGHWYQQQTKWHLEKPKL